MTQSDEVEADGQRSVQMRSEQAKNPPPAHETGRAKTEKLAQTAIVAGKKPKKLKIRCSAEWWFPKRSRRSYFVTETETKFYETQK